MTLRMMPDAEKLVSAALRADVDVQALVGQRVYTVLPDAKVWPLLRLQRVGGPTIATPDDDAAWMEHAQLQLEAYGGPKAQAWAVANTVKAVLLQRVPGLHADALVERCTVGSSRYLPDPTWTPAQPRVVFDATIYLRPAGDAPTP